MAKNKTTAPLSMTTTGQQIIKVIMNPDMDIDAKVDMLHQWLDGGQSPDVKRGVRQALAKLIQGGEEPDEKTAKLQEQLEKLIKEIMAGPQKEAYYIGKGTSLLGVDRALVEIDNGERGYLSIPDEELAGVLRVGDTIMVSMKAGAVTGLGCKDTVIGEEVHFTRRIDDTRVEIRTRGDEKRVVRLAEDLSDQIKEGTVKPGSTLVMNRAGTLAREVVNPQDGFAHYRFLERVPVPDVRVDRDIGAPARCIDEITEMLRVEMTNPAVRRKYKMRRCIMQLLAGVSGAGKTLTIHAIWRRMYEVMSEVTGVSIDKLPPRVFWLRPGRLLSKWFGESEQLIEQAMDEIQGLADEKFVTDTGEEVTLPVMVVMEEVDGIARSREGSGDNIYSRVLTTLLQRLDPSQPALQQRLVVFLGTTNEPGQVDRAFLRRIGGQVAQFGQLDQKGFELVLDKHLRDLPLAGNGTQAVLRRKFSDRLSSWLFDVANDPGIAQITISGKEARCNRSDFLTGGLIDRSVQAAASDASDKESKGNGDGITLKGLAEALEEQLITLGNQLTVENLGKYMALPDGARVTKLVRIPGKPLPDMAI